MLKNYDTAAASRLPSSLSFPCPAILMAASLICRALFSLQR